ncbi:MAG: KH domain-containing protein [Victivallaceae bacterium]|nr:KH domain-containing protein [Victivallaceae bacterium]
MFGFLKKIFGGSEGSEAGRSAASAAGLGEIEGFVDYVVRSLVDTPDAVKVRSDEDGNVLNISIVCNEEDRGKIIGRRGKTINAIRALANGAAGRMQKKVTVEVVD